MGESLIEKIKESRTLLENPYAYLAADGTYEATEVSSDSDDTFLLSEEQLASIKSLCKQRPLSDKNIEKIAIKLQKILWENNRIINDPIKLLYPSDILKAIGYTYNLSDTLGQYSSGHQSFEVAGIIDTENKSVQISRQFPDDVQKFTYAHELGHALLHEQEAKGLHRDRAPDGANQNQRNSIEYQADKFAVYFLMPEKPLRKIFKKLFLTECFVLTEATIFALGSTVTKKINNVQSTRELSRLLAKTESYNGQYFYSLARQFGVSTEAMAIRLEELRLLKF